MQIHATQDLALFAVGRAHYAETPDEAAVAADTVYLSGETEAKPNLETLQTLHRSGRLFIESEGKLKRAQPFEIRRAVEGKGKAFVITRVGGEDSEQTTRFEEHQVVDCNLIILVSHHEDHRQDTTHQITEEVDYLPFPLNEWADLDFVDLDQPGVTGTPFLPEPGGTVTRDLKWEQTWMRQSKGFSEVFGGYGGGSLEGVDHHGHHSIERGSMT